MNCTLCGVRLINRGDKKISDDTIERTVECPSCGTVRTYKKVYPKPIIKNWKVIPTKDGMVVNPKIVIRRTKGSFDIKFDDPRSRIGYKRPKDSKDPKVYV